MEIEQCSIELPLGQEIKREIKDVLEFSKIEGTMYRNLWDTMKAVLRGKFITLSAYIQKLEKTQTSDLTAHLNTIEQKEEVDFLQRKR